MLVGPGMAIEGLLLLLRRGERERRKARMVGWGGVVGTVLVGDVEGTLKRARENGGGVVGGREVWSKVSWEVGIVVDTEGNVMGVGRELVGDVAAGEGAFGGGANGLVAIPGGECRPESFASIEHNPDIAATIEASPMGTTMPIVAAFNINERTSGPFMGNIQSMDTTTNMLPDVLMEGTDSGFIETGPGEMPKGSRMNENTESVEGQRLNI